MFNFITSPTSQPLFASGAESFNVTQSQSQTNLHSATQPKASYSRDMWDSNGVRAITDRIEESRKSMKFIQNFFQDSAKNSFNTSQTMSKLATTGCSQHEIGSLKYSLDRFMELIETMSKNEEILGSKIRTNCQQKLTDQMKKFEKINNKLVNDLNDWHKRMQKESKQLSKAQQNYDEKKKQAIAADQSLQTESQRLQTFTKNQVVGGRISQVQSAVQALQNKVAYLRSQAKEAKDQYLDAVKSYRGFRLQFDSQTAVFLEQLEHIEVERAKMFHRLLTTYLEIQEVMVSQSLKNVETIKGHISVLNPQSDNVLFVERFRTNRRKPPLPDPILYPDDREDIAQPPPPELSEDTPEVKKWCANWRLVISKILGRDADLSISSAKNDNPQTSNNNSNETVNVQQNFDLPPEDFEKLKAQCLESLNTSEGRMAFAILLNRQRNADHGLELEKEQFFALVKLVEKFCDSVEKHEPIDVKPAKLVMIMTQSLYVRKENILNDLTPEERGEFETVRIDKNTSISKDEPKPVPPLVNKQNSNDHEKKEENKTEEKELFTRSTSLLPKRDKLFLVDRIKDHRLWKLEAFWKEAFRDSLQQEFKKYPILQKWHSQQEVDEADRRNKEITFSQLAAITHNMKEFGMQNNTIINFLENQNLSPEKQAMLKATLGVVDNNMPLSSGASSISTTTTTTTTTTGTAKRQSQLPSAVELVDSTENNNWDINVDEEPPKGMSFDEDFNNLSGLETAHHSNRSNIDVQLDLEPM